MNMYAKTDIDIPMVAPCEWDERDITPADLLYDTYAHGDFTVRACGRKEESNLQDNPGYDTVIAAPPKTYRSVGTVVMSPSVLQARARERMYANLRKQLQDANVRKVRAQVQGDRDTYLAARALASDLRALLHAGDREPSRGQASVPTAIVARVGGIARTASRLAKAGIIIGAVTVLLSGIIAGCLGS